MPALRNPTVSYVALGVAAGVIAAIFGVGGGIVVIPALIAGLAFAPKDASGTSLAAIGLTAAFGVAVYAVLGRVDWEAAALVGGPGLVGVLAGTAIQRRLSSRVLVLAFCCLLVAVAVLLLVE